MNVLNSVNFKAKQSEVNYCADNGKLLELMLFNIFKIRQIDIFMLNCLFDILDKS